jgi:hypothetical protein
MNFRSGPVNANHSAHNVRGIRFNEFLTKQQTGASTLRAKKDYQLPLTAKLGEHDHVDELCEISRVLDENPEVTDLV